MPSIPSWIIHAMSGPRNPWGNDGGDDDRPRGESPWGKRPGPGGGNNGNRGGGPDVDEMLRQVQRALRAGMPGGGGFGAGKLVALAGVAAVALWMSSGFYFIQPNENGVVLTFGKYTRTDETPGLKYRLPWPVQTVDILDVTTERRTQIGFREESGPSISVDYGRDLTNAASGRRITAPESLRSSSNLTDVPDESLMLTGDENIIDIDFVVLWRVSNAKDYLYEVRNPQDTIKIVAESAMREIIGQTNIQSALTEARNDIQNRTRALMQKVLDEYKVGVTINNVQLQKVDPPAAVVDAFNDVQRARADKERLRNEAEAYRNDVIPRARGESEQIRQQAGAYKEQIVNRAKGDAERFTSVYAAYSKAKAVTAERLYLETMESVLGKSKTIVLDAGKGGAGAIPYLPLNELRRSTTTPQPEPLPAPSPANALEPASGGARP